jgi:hypothetical protein
VEVGSAVSAVMELDLDLSHRITGELAQEMTAKEKQFGVRIQLRRW